MNSIHFNVWCQAYYPASIAVHDDFTKEEALEHAKSMLASGFLPRPKPLNILPSSSEIDVESLKFEDEME